MLRAARPTPGARAPPDGCQGPAHSAASAPAPARPAHRFRVAAAQRPNPGEQLAAIARSQERELEQAESMPWLAEVLPGTEPAVLLRRDPKLAGMSRAEAEAGLLALRRAVPDLDGVRLASWAPVLLRQSEDATRDTWRRLAEHFEGSDVASMVRNRPALLDAQRTSAMLAEWSAVRGSHAPLTSLRSRTASAQPQPQPYRNRAQPPSLRCIPVSVAPCSCCCRRDRRSRVPL